MKTGTTTLNPEPISRRRPESPADAMLLSIIHAAPVGLAAFAPDTTLLMINETACTLLGHGGLPAAGDGCIGLRGSRRLHGLHWIQLERLILGRATNPSRIVTADGMPLSIERHIGHDGNAVLSITPLRASADRQPEAASATHRDALTGLADRRTFLSQLTALCQPGQPENASAGHLPDASLPDASLPDASLPDASLPDPSLPDTSLLTPSLQPLAVMIVDLDGFKLVNDALGHAAGDAMLKLVGQRLRGMLRKADVISRLGGDEFAIAIPSSPDIPEIANRLVSILSRPYLVDRQVAVISASVGIACFPEHGSTADEIVRAADVALHRAKKHGRGSVQVFDRELGEGTRTRFALAEDLRRAIPLQQLELHYQPQVCLKTRKLSGFEALLRWNHPERGRIGPDEFIALAEETGLIDGIGEWVLQQACHQAASWPGDLTIAVNVSPRQLLDRDRLPRAIAASLASTGLPPHRLEIEITETALVQEAAALDLLQTFHTMGLRVSMDDFGTGYSSLSQLRRFPFDKLKIDRSFVRDLCASQSAAAVFRAIAALGNGLGMLTIAEGVETEQQAAQCLAHECSAMQGFLVSRPVPAASVSNLIQYLS